MGRGGEDDTQDEEQGCKDNASPSPETVNGYAKEKHAEDLADEIGI